MIFKRLLKAIVLPVLLLISIAVSAQDKVVTGKVTDSKTGAGLAGVSVTVKGTKIGVQTGIDGSYSIKVPASATTLVISSVGFGKTELAISGNTMPEVKLVETNASLNDVVVVGYGTQRKRDVTASIAKISSDKIASVPAPSFESALAGKAAGVQVSTTGGMAGSAAIIRIRGVNSISIPGDPLYVIDGLPIDATYLNGPTRNTLGQDRNPLANLNPNDIESVEILKDAGAAGIYGSRGSNGVVLITTKRGRGKAKINFTSRLGFTGPSVKTEFVDKDTWLKLRQEAWELDGNTGLQQNLPGKPGGFSLTDAQNNPGTDWWNLAKRTGVTQDYNLSLSKGVGKFNYYVGGSYSKEQSYIIGNDYQRIGIRGNVDYKALKNLTFSLNGAFNNGTSNLVNNGWNGGIGLAMSTGLPYYPVYNSDGSFFRTISGSNTTWGDGAGNNLVAQRDNAKYRSQENRTIGAFTTKYTPIKNLDVSGTVSYEQNNSLFNSYKTAWFLTRAANAQGNAENNLNKYTNLSYNATVNYIWDLNNNNKFTFLVGTEYQEQKTNNKYTYLDSALSPLYDGGKTGKIDSAINSSVENTTYNKLFRSYFARVNYNLKGKYIFQASIRRDESSVFRENNKYAWFPTVSAAWNISQEKFMEGFKKLDNLKLRASYGLTGSSAIPWNAGYPSFDTSRNTGGYYGGQPTIYRSNLGNPNLKWETSTNVDVALEWGILKNRISGEFGYYRKESKDVLLEVPVSGYNGVGGSQWQNQGSILNEGLEFSINTVNIKTKDFSWSTNFNIAFNKNRVLDIGQLLPDAIGGGTNETRIVPGYPVGTIFTVRYYGVDPADGLPIYIDRSGKLTKTLNVASGSVGDKVPVASVLPDYTGGLTNTFKYKQFELNTVFTYQYGGHIWDNSGKRNLGFITDWNIYSMYVGNYWRKPGDVARYPRPTLKGYPGVEGNPWSNNSSVQVFNSDFVRLKELTLSYYVPSNLLTKWKMSSAKVFFGVYNAFLFTNYPVGDPEGGRDGENDAARNQSGNANFLNPPLQRSFNFGINVSF